MWTPGWRRAMLIHSVAVAALLEWMFRHGLHARHTTGAHVRAREHAMVAIERVCFSRGAVAAFA